MAIKIVWPVEHSCGHEQAHDLGEKKAADRAGYARWLATKECSDCWRAARDKANGKDRETWLAERRAEEAATIEAWERKAEMPALDGSDKAVQWGRRVRHELMSAAFGYGQESGQPEDDFVVEVEVPARRVTLASWWIDQRDMDPGDVAELVASATTDSATDTGTENPF